MEAPSIQIVTLPVIPVILMSTIFVELASNGVLEKVAGLTVGAIVATAVPPLLERSNLILGRFSVVGIRASVTLAGKLITFEFGVGPVVTTGASFSHCA